MRFLPVLDIGTKQDYRPRIGKLFACRIELSLHGRGLARTTLDLPIYPFRPHRIVAETRVVPTVADRAWLPRTSSTLHSIPADNCSVAPHKAAP